MVLDQLRTVATQVFLTRLLNDEEQRPAEAYPIARQLALAYPGNAYFQRYYTFMAFQQGDFEACERTSRRLLEGLNQGLPGYEGVSGRYASYFLGYLMQHKYRDGAKAKDHFQRCIVFAESTGDTQGGFYLFAHANLARLAVVEKDLPAARRYYQVVADKAARKSHCAQEAKAFLKRKAS